MAGSSKETGDVKVERKTLSTSEMKSAKADMGYKNDEFMASRYEKLDEKAFREACKRSEGSSLWVKLDSNKDISNAAKAIRGFDYRVVGMINKWAHSPNPEREIDRISINGKKGSDYRKEEGCTFMDCMVTAQSAIERNKPAVEFDMSVTRKQKKFDEKMTLSDPGFKNIPPSHMPGLLNQILKTVTLGFFQNREERMNHHKELEMIRFGAMEKEKQARLQEDEKTVYAGEVKQKKELNAKQAEEAQKKKQEFLLEMEDVKHGKEGLAKMEKFAKEVPQRLEKLAKGQDELDKQKKELLSSLKELRDKAKAANEYLKENPDWKADPEKRKVATNMMAGVQEYRQAREAIIANQEKSARNERIMKKMAETEANRPQLVGLYKLQLEHKLTEKDREELNRLEGRKTPGEREREKAEREKIRNEEILRKTAEKKKELVPEMEKSKKQEEKTKVK